MAMFLVEKFGNGKKLNKLYVNDYTKSTWLSNF
jgi:hypothetical protein